MVIILRGDVKVFMEVFCDFSGFSYKLSIVIKNRHLMLWVHLEEFRAKLLCFRQIDLDNHLGSFEQKTVNRSHLHNVSGNFVYLCCEPGQSGGRGEDEGVDFIIGHYCGVFSLVNDF